MAYAHRHFAMSARQPDGSTLRQHLTVAARVSPEARAELAKDAPPGPLGYLWELFLELHGRRGIGGMGPSPITWPDLHAWATLTRRTLDAWQYDIIAALDNEFFASTSLASERS